MSLERSERHYGLSVQAATEGNWPLPKPRANVYEFCRGPCASGTKLCPTPQGCERGEPEPPTFWGSLVELLKFWRKS